MTPARLGASLTCAIPGTLNRNARTSGIQIRSLTARSAGYPGPVGMSGARSDSQLLHRARLSTEYFLPHFDFRGEQLVQLLRRAGRRFHPDRADAVANFRKRQDARDFLRQLVDDGARHLARCEDAEPAIIDVTRQAGFSDGWHIRQRGAALRRGDGDAVGPPRLD